MDQYTVTVRTSTAYDVVIGAGLLGQAGAYLRSCTAAQRVLLVSDRNVYRRYGAAVTQAMAGFSVSPFVIEPGEGAKSMETLAKLLNAAAGHGLRRQDGIVALGGGVVGDLAGLAAALYMRGIPYVQMPTTLLSAVDASVGGKTAVDLPGGKNLAGAFWQPACVLCDCTALDTLPPGEFANGMAEVIKYGVIRDPEILSAAERGATGLPRLIARCVAIKRDLVEADERDVGVRRLLNFGHTIGHALEKASGYTLGHGAAVAVGMVYATKLAEQAGLCAGMSPRLSRCLEKYGLPVSPAYPWQTLVPLMELDKKNAGSRAVTMVLPLTWGQCQLVAFPPEELLARLTEIDREDKA